MNNITVILKQRYPGLKNITHLARQASVRNFFRIQFNKYSLIAMVYPKDNYSEIQSIIRLSETYNSFGLKTPDNIEILNNRILIQEDCGNMLLDQYFNSQSEKEKKKTLGKILDMLLVLRKIPLEFRTEVLDNSRMKWEMLFFCNYFAKQFFSKKALPEIQNNLFTLVDRINDINTFAHRDFHSQNMMISRDNIYLVDIQNSLQGPQYYDLVSFLYDSYLNTKSFHKQFLYDLQKRGLLPDNEQFYLTALQRNIKALGSFGYQINIMKNEKYKLYIKKTLTDIEKNPFYSGFLNDIKF